MLSLRRVEPPICEQMRKYLNQNLKLFHEYIFKDNKRFMATALTSQSDKLNEAISDVQKADSQALTDLTTLADQFLKDINEKCAKLSTVQTLSDINKQVDELRATQLSTATELAAIPKKYEDEMQASYTPVENIIGTQ